ncbi:MAG: DUF86 domain-containing protein [Candidatus Taylorbacteria bacterium]|nr:DUF86 domain-containing protein [Candidatus Taylorbacteria bacterium]
MKDEKIYIEQMLDSVAKIEAFISGMDKADFLKDPKTQSAVIMQLTVIGELVKKISLQTKESSDLPWKEIAGFRDKAIHEYFGMDLDVVWDTVIMDIPILKTELTKLRMVVYH